MPIAGMFSLAVIVPLLPLPTLRVVVLDLTAFLDLTLLLVLALLLPIFLSTCIALLASSLRPPVPALDFGGAVLCAALTWPQFLSGSILSLIKSLFLQPLSTAFRKEQFYQATSETDNIVFGTPTAYCGYSVDLYPLVSGGGYDYYSSALGHIDLGGIDQEWWLTSQSLCNFKISVTGGTHHLAWCTSYEPTDISFGKCPKGWGYIGPNNRVTFSSSNYVEPVTSRRLKTAPQYLGKTTTEGEIVHFGDPSSYCGYAFSCYTPYGGSQGDPSSFGLSTGLGRFRYYSSSSSPSRCPSYLVTGSGYWVAPCYALRDDFECPKSWGYVSQSISSKSSGYYVCHEAYSDVLPQYLG